MLSKPRFPRLNDGVAIVYRETEARRAPGLDPSGTDGLEVCTSLAFQDKTNRQQDGELAEAQGFTLTRKILVRDAPALSRPSLVGIGGIIYEVGYVDRSGGFAYLYLDSIEVDGQVSLVDAKQVCGSLGIVDEQEDVTLAWCRRRSWSRSRVLSAGADDLAPSLRCVVRIEDWAAQPVVRAGRDYTVTTARGKGRWVEIEATRKVGDK